MKQKTSKNLNLLVWCTVFQPELKKHQKTIKPIIKRSLFDIFSKCTKPKNSTLLKFFASFDTHHTTRSAKIVEKLLFLHLFFRFRDSGATQNFFFILKVKPDVYFISLSGKKREILIIYESKMQKLLSATASEGVHLERISFKCPTVDRNR